MDARLLAAGGLLAAAAGAAAIAAGTRDPGWWAAFVLSAIALSVAALGTWSPERMGRGVPAACFGALALATLFPFSQVLGFAQFAVGYLAAAAGFGLAALGLARPGTMPPAAGMALAGAGFLGVFAAEATTGIVGPALPVLVVGAGLAAASGALWGGRGRRAAA